MQIDFHHGVTYLCARLAGFTAREANVIAYSAQYVDDATNSGSITFDNDMMYARISSAHKMLDHRNMNQLADHQVWLPFHFLPGNDGNSAPETIPPIDSEGFIHRCICRPNSLVAKEMMADVIRRHARPYALHRLGIAAHVYFDTWAHQGFVGFQHAVNSASNIEADDAHHKKPILQRLKDFFQDDWDETVSDFVGNVLPLGHGAVLSYPDRPYLKWSYTNGHGEHVERNNPKDFFEAATELFQMFCRFRKFAAQGEQVFGHSEVPPTGAFELLQASISEIRDEDAEVRHQCWLDLIGNGRFGFAEQVSYVPKGVGSWKHAALGTEADGADEGVYAYTPKFLSSDWKLFHDALQAHRLYILNELLPRFGLISA